MPGGGGGGGIAPGDVGIPGAPGGGGGGGGGEGVVADEAAETSFPPCENFCSNSLILFSKSSLILTIEEWESSSSLSFFSNSVI